MGDNIYNAWARIAHAEVLNSTRGRERAIYKSTSEDPFPMLTNRTTLLSNFTSRAFPKLVQELPVLYLFGGLDVLNAYAAFPRAPSYVLMADLPLGWPGAKACFRSPECSTTARQSAIGFLRHTHQYSLAWTSTEKMQQLFSMRGDIGRGHMIQKSEPVGVLPSLLLCARLLGYDIVGVRSLHLDNEAALGRPRRSQYASNLTGVVVETSGPKLVYVSLAIPLDRDDSLGWGWRPMPVVDQPGTARALADLEHALSHTFAGMRPVVVLKAAPHFINRAPAMARWVLRTAAATLHDETGLVPDVYNGTALSSGVSWAARGFGRFVDWTFRERFWYGKEEGLALKRVCPGPDDLPFRWGYAAGASPTKHVGNGVLIAGWRQDLSF